MCTVQSPRCIFTGLAITKTFANVPRKCPSEKLDDRVFILFQHLIQYKTTIKQDSKKTYYLGYEYVGTLNDQHDSYSTIATVIPKVGDPQISFENCKSANFGLKLFLSFGDRKCDTLRICDLRTQTFCDL